MDNKQQPQEEEKAIFNMAISTLQRLGRNLEEQKQLEYKIGIPMAERQSIKLGLVQQFFVQASPLLPETEVKNYKKEVLNLKPSTIIDVEKRPMSIPIKHPPRLNYDSVLAFRLNEIIVELQMILQKSGYFMPSADDSGDEYQ